MATLHLAIDVDSEVYPELHAALTAIGSESSRAERLRQLAAAGLVWEKIRLGIDGVPLATVALEGSAVVAPTGAAAMAAPPPRAAAERATDAPLRPMPPPTPEPVPRQTPAQVPASLQAQAQAQVQPASRVPPSAPVPAGFVDLALDASAPSPTAAWPPVLVDVVDPMDWPSAPQTAPARRTRQPPPAAYAPVEPDEPPEPPPPPEPPIEHQASTRSRLQRMRDRGLFRNG